MQREPHFHLFGVPVYVHPMHFAVGLLLGWMRYRALNASVAIYVVLVFVAILLHEMGHALTARRFGLDPFVELVGWGGVTHFGGGRLLSAGRSILVAFAGPAVGLALGGGVLLWRMYTPIALAPMLASSMDDFVWVNLGWAIFNLVPIFPLDGGLMLRTALERFFGVRGVRWAHLASLVLAAALVALSIPLMQIFMIAIFGQLAFVNWQHFQAAGRWIDRVGNARRRITTTPVPPASQPAREGAAPASFDAELQRGWRALEEGRSLVVRMVGEALLLRVESDAQRYEVLHLLAWGRLLSGDARGAKSALGLLPKGKLPDALLEGALRLELGEAEQAVPLLAEGIVGRSDDFVASRLGKAAALSGVVAPIRRLLERGDVAKEIGARSFQVVVADLFSARRYEAAIELGQLLFTQFGLGADAFNVACAFGKLLRGDEALRWLDRALDAGLDDPSVLDTDADLSDVRSLPGFEALRAKAGLSS